MCRDIGMSSVRRSILSICSSPVRSTVLFISFHFPLLTTLCIVHHAHHRSSLTLFCGATPCSPCTTGMFRCTGMNTSIIGRIEGPQLGRNCHLMWLIILLGTVAGSMVVVIKRWSRRETRWRFEMNRAAKGKQYCLLAVRGRINSAVATHWSFVAQALRPIYLSIAVGRRPIMENC